MADLGKKWKLVFDDLTFQLQMKFDRGWWHPSELWYRLKCVLWYRYRVVKPRYLGHFFEEYNNVLAHAMFEVLSRFLEEDCPKAHVEWYGEKSPKVMVNGQEQFVFDEMKDLYAWWHDEYNKGYPAQKAAFDKEIEDHAPFAVYREEDGAKIFDPQFATEHDERCANDAVQQSIELDKRMACELDSRLHRILNIRLWIWT